MVKIEQIRDTVDGTTAPAWLLMMTYTWPCAAVILALMLIVLAYIYTHPAGDYEVHAPPSSANSAPLPPWQRTYLRTPPTR